MVRDSRLSSTKYQGSGYLSKVDIVIQKLVDMVKFLGVHDCGGQGSLWVIRIPLPNPAADRQAATGACS